MKNNNFIIIMGIALTTCIASLSAIPDNKRINQKQKYPELVKFLAKYAPPAKLQKLLEKHKDKIAEKYKGTIKEIPEIYLKGGEIDRVINAERMRNVIKKYDLDCLDVPRKYVYEIDGELRVIAEKVKPSHTSSDLSLKETQQLTKLAEETGFRDWGATETNVWRNDKNKLVFIDTENASFHIGFARIAKIPQHCKAQFVVAFLPFKNSMVPEAQTWLKEYIKSVLKKYKDQYEKNIEDPILPDSTAFDNPEIDFEKVKVQLEQYKKAREEELAKKESPTKKDK